MKNFYQDGKTLPLTMAANVKSGQLVNIGAFVGVCACDAAAGEIGETAIVGVFIFPKVTADAFTQGQAVKFDPATGVCSAAGTVAAGVATRAAGAGSTEVYVRLTPGLGTTVALAEAEAAPTKHEHAKEAAKHSHGEPVHAR